jgi:hypothetical protein
MDVMDIYIQPFYLAFLAHTLFGEVRLERRLFFSLFDLAYKYVIPC